MGGGGGGQQANTSHTQEEERHNCKAHERHAKQAHAHAHGRCSPTVRPRSWLAASSASHTSRHASRRAWRPCKANYGAALAATSPNTPARPGQAQRRCCCCFHRRRAVRGFDACRRGRSHPARPLPPVRYAGRSWRPGRRERGAVRLVWRGGTWRSVYGTAAHAAQLTAGRRLHLRCRQKDATRDAV